ncbi:hypothetical protein KIPB_012278, partial [Kipferlia bialata]
SVSGDWLVVASLNLLYLYDLTDTDWEEGYPYQVLYHPLYDVTDLSESVDYLHATPPDPVYLSVSIDSTLERVFLGSSESDTLLVYGLQTYTPAAWELVDRLDVPSPAAYDSTYPFYSNASPKMTIDGDTLVVASGDSLLWYSVSTGVWTLERTVTVDYDDTDPSILPIGSIALGPYGLWVGQPSIQGYLTACGAVTLHSILSPITVSETVWVTLPYANPLQGIVTMTDASGFSLT